MQEYISWPTELSWKMLKIPYLTKIPHLQTIKWMYDALLCILQFNYTQLSRSLRQNSAIIWLKTPGVSRKITKCQHKAPVPDRNTRRSTIHSRNTKLSCTLSRVTWSFFWDWFLRIYIVLRLLLVRLSSILWGSYSRFNNQVVWKLLCLVVEAGWSKYQL